MDNKNRQKLLLIIVGIAVGLYVADLVLFTPLMDSWNARWDRVADLQKKVNKGTVELKSQASVDGKWQRMEDNSLPQDRSAAEAKVFAALQNWEQDTRLKIDRKQPQWKEGEDYTTLGLRIDATGDMQTILQFLYDVESSLPINALKVEQMELSTHDNDGRQLTLGLDLDGLVIPPQTETK